VVVVGGALWLWQQWWGKALVLLAAALLVVLVVRAAVQAPQRRRARLQRLAALHGLLDLTPAQFEHAVAELLSATGYRDVRVSGGAGDLQADITATDPDDRRTVVQCKRYAPHRTIGSPVVQSFIGMAAVHHAAQRALIVTTARFSEPARDLAALHGVELVEGEELAARFAGLARAAAAKADRAA
jgi:restriction system protein